MSDILLTSMCSKGGGVGRDLIPVLKGDCLVIAVQDFWGGQLFTYWKDQQYWPDYICVNDPVGTQIVSKAWPEFNPKSIKELGYAALDTYASVNVDEISAITKEQLSIGDDLPVVLFAGEKKGTGETLLELVRVLNHIGQDVYLLPKQHPRMTEDPDPAEHELWSQALSEFSCGKIVTVPSSLTPKEVIACATVVVSMYSTMLVEAATLKKPTVAMLYPDVGMKIFLESMGGGIDKLPLVTLGCCTQVSKHDQTYNILEQCLITGSLGQEHNQGKTFKLNGRNAEKIADFVETLT